MYEKFNRVPAESIEAGDICVVCGIDDIQIRETIADRNFGKPLPSINIEEATAKMAFSINMSPFVGREFALYCRRRERYEFMVGTPKVIYVKVNDKLLEPFEIATVEEWKEYMGVVELLGKRRGQMIDTQGIGHCCCWSLRLRKSVFHSRSSLYSSVGTIIIIMIARTYIKKITEKFEKLGLKVPKAGEKTAMEGLESVTNAKCAAASLSNFKMTFGKYKPYAVAAGLATGIGAIGWYLLSDDKKAK